MDDRSFPRSPPCRGVADSSFQSIGAYPPEWSKARRSAAARVLLAAFALLLVVLAGCSRPAPEEALRRTIATMQEAAEGRDADGLVDHLAEDFVGPGGMDRDRFRRYAALVWLRNREVGITLGPLDVEVTGEHARVRFTAATRGGTGLLPDSGNLYQVDTAWRIQGGEWRMISADWDGAMGP
jgi:hypothetical protein